MIITIYNYYNQSGEITDDVPFILGELKSVSDILGDLAKEQQNEETTDK